MADSYHSTFGYVRRGMLFILALLILGVVLFGAYQWKTYHRNLAVGDANLSPFPALTDKDRILVFSPHPDDETLGAGGLMAKARSMGIPVRVVFMTNGDGSLATRLVQDAHFVEQMATGKDPKRPRNIYRQIAPMRQKEALAALAKLNIAAKDVTFLGYPDGGTKQMWETNWNASNPFRSPYTKTNHSPYTNSWTPNAPYCGAQVLEDLKQIITDYKPTIVITTNPYDTHPDHWAANAYLGAAVSQLQLQQKYVSWAQKIKSYTFIVHHGLWPAPHGYHPDAQISPPAALMQVGIPWLQLQLDKKEETAKANALQQYKSQLATTPQFLRGFLRRNELFAQSKSQSGSFQKWNTVIHDPRNDLLLPRLVSAADITSVSVKMEAQKVLLVRLDLDGKPWNDLKYQLMLHLITPHEVMLQKIIVSADSNNHWQGVIINNSNQQEMNSQNITVERVKTQLTIHIPMNLLTAKQVESNTTLISASSILHKRTLDQTPTIIIQ